MEILKVRKFDKFSKFVFQLALCHSLNKKIQIIKIFEISIKKASKRDLALKLRQHEPEWNMQYHHKWGKFQPEETCNFNINEFRTSGKLKMVGNE